MCSNISLENKERKVSFFDFSPSPESISIKNFLEEANNEAENYLKNSTFSKEKFKTDWKKSIKKFFTTWKTKKEEVFAIYEKTNELLKCENFSLPALQNQRVIVNNEEKDFIELIASLVARKGKATEESFNKVHKNFKMITYLHSASEIFTENKNTGKDDKNKELGITNKNGFYCRKEARRAIVASEKIKSAYKSFSQRKNNKTPGYADLVCMTHHSKKNNTTYTYFHPPAHEGIKWVRLATKPVEKKARARGSSKCLIYSDNDFVTLKINPENFEHQSSVIEKRKLFSKLKTYSSFIINLRVLPYYTAGRNGGDSLGMHLKNNKPVKIKQFKKACEDLELIHGNGWAHRDIKPDNFTEKNGGDIKFIDNDDMLLTNKNKDKKHSICTPLYITGNLYKKKKEGDLAAIKRADIYAFLLSMFETTQHTASQHLDIMYKKAYKEGIPSMGLFSYINNKKTIAFANKWLDKVVKPEYINDVRNFLENPVSDLPKPLSEIIKWDAEF